MRNAYKIFIGILKERDLLKSLAKKMILRLFLKEWLIRMWTS